MSATPSHIAARPPHHARRALVRLAGRVLSGALLLAALGVLVLTVLLPRVAGAVPYTVLTGSMAPALPPGTLVVVRPVAPADVAVGDVVTYQLRSGEPTVVTHRVVQIDYDATGAPRFVTRGDANTVPDAAPVQPVQVRGVVWYHLPWLGRLGPLLTLAQRQHLVVGTAVGLLVYAALQGRQAVRAARQPASGRVPARAGAHRA
ncbi:signal peptidase I [Nocardioides sp.]|uniref:signal peptidase I n=1 Tax=Nocardioides sp. TaxID=35761 RepID=UPI003510E793